MIIFFLLFLVLTGIILVAAGLGFRFIERHNAQRISGALETAVQKIQAPQARVVVHRLEEREHAVDRVMRRLSLARVVRSRIYQAGLDWSPTRFAGFSAAGAALGAFLGYRLPVLVSPVLTAAAAAALLGFTPWFYISHKASRRLARFEESFPEALDFLARAMKAGYAFTVSLGMLDKNAPEPLRSEFARVYSEQNLGESLPVVLTHLTERVPLVDVRLFVSAVMLQRETGGNLGEILVKLAMVIRERFRLRGQVRSASAHGRITALILTVMPIACAAGMSLVAPGYLAGMAGDSIGRYLILGAVMAQAAGYLVMKRIVNIKV